MPDLLLESRIFVSSPAVHTPPRHPANSTSRTLAPARAAARAAATPAGPPPQTPLGHGQGPRRLQHFAADEVGRASCLGCAHPASFDH